MSELPPRLAEIVGEFQEVDRTERLDLLFEYANDLPDLPAEGSYHTLAGLILALLRRTGLPEELRMLIVGERSGEMGAMLTRSAAFYDGEITRWIDRFMRSFEPILMAAIGLVVGVIVVLLYMPIFDLAGSF